MNEPPEQMKTKRTELLSKEPIPYTQIKELMFVHTFCEIHAGAFSVENALVHA
jgi:hypothetical protein